MTQTPQRTLSDTTISELREIAARYPEPRSGLLPMLHLIQSAQGMVTSEGIETCAEILDISAADVSGVATFYTMYKRRPVGDYLVGVCTNTLCAVMGGDEIFARVKDHLGIGNDETTDDRLITLEHIECNAACDYAPVMTVNWEFMDNMTPTSATDLLDDLRAGKSVSSTRGPRLCTWREAERVLAGFPDGLVDDGPSAGPHSLVGLALAKDRGWAAPESDEAPADDPTAAGDPSPAVPSEPSEKEQAAKETQDDTAHAATVEEQSGTTETAAEKDEAQ